MKRRNFLYFSVAFLGLADSSDVIAQSNASIRAEVKIFQDRLPSVFSPDARFASDPEEISRFLEQEFAARRDFFEAISGATAQQIIDSRAAGTEAIFEFAADDAEEFAVRPSTLAPIKLGRTYEPNDSDTRAQVVLDIVKETLGLSFLDDAFLVLMESDTDFARFIAAIGDHLGVQDYSGAVEALKALVLWMVSEAGFEQLRRAASQLPPSVLRRRLITALGSRMIPFVGWAFTGTCFIACVYAHRRRLAYVFR